MKKMWRRGWLAVTVIVLVAFAAPGWAAPARRAADPPAPGDPAPARTPAVQAAQPGGRVQGAQELPPVRGYRFSGDVRELPPVAAAPLLRDDEDQAVVSAKPWPAAGAVAFDQLVTPAMPAPLTVFEGLAFNGSCTGGACGAGYPPDTVGDVGPNHYVQAVNTAVGIFSKTGASLAAFTFNSLWSGAGTGTACDANNQGDPTVVYDPLADRWIVADFAFVSPSSAPYYECIAVSNSGDPVAGGWTLFALRTDDAGHPYLADYPKMGVWPDGVYLTANEFNAGSTFVGVRIWAINRAQLENAGILQVQMVSLGTNVYSLLPGNLRGAVPPAGSPAYLATESTTAYQYDVYTLHVDWATPANTILNGPYAVSQTVYGLPWSPSGSTNIVPQPGTNTQLDTLGDRLMMQLQYRNLSGVESLWVAHTVRPTGANTGPTGIQWAQLNVTGGVIQAGPVQEQIFTNGGDGLYRWMPSIAVDSAGNALVGYSSSSSASFPSLRWAGRLAGDPLNTLGQGEGTLFAGTGSQAITCGGSACHRWGDYSAMTVDPADDCTFWYTNEYYVTSGDASWHTRIGSVKLPGCPPPVTPTPTATATNTPTNTPTPTATATITPTPTATNTPTATITPTPTATNTPTATITPTPTATPTNTPTPTATPTNTPTPTITPTPTATPTSTPTNTPSSTPTPTGTPTPALTPRAYLPVVINSLAQAAAGKQDPGFERMGPPGPSWHWTRWLIRP